MKHSYVATSMKIATSKDLYVKRQQRFVELVEGGCFDKAAAILREYKAEFERSPLWRQTSMLWQFEPKVPFGLLHEAVAEADMDTVKGLLQCGASTFASSTEYDGLNAVEYAAMQCINNKNSGGCSDGDGAPNNSTIEGTTSAAASHVSFLTTFLEVMPFPLQAHDILTLAARHNDVQVLQLALKWLIIERQCRDRLLPQGWFLDALQVAVEASHLECVEALFSSADPVSIAAAARFIRDGDVEMGMAFMKTGHVGALGASKDAEGTLAAFAANHRSVTVAAALFRSDRQQGRTTASNIPEAAKRAEIDKAITAAIENGRRTMLEWLFQRLGEGALTKALQPSQLAVRRDWMLRKAIHCDQSTLFVIILLHYLKGRHGEGQLPRLECRGFLELAVTYSAKWVLLLFTDLDGWWTSSIDSGEGKKQVHAMIFSSYEDKSVLHDFVSKFTVDATTGKHVKDSHCFHLLASKLSDTKKREAATNASPSLVEEGASRKDDLVGNSTAHQQFAADVLDCYVRTIPTVPDTQHTTNEKIAFIKELILLINTTDTTTTNVKETALKTFLEELHVKSRYIVVENALSAEDVVAICNGIIEAYPSSSMCTAAFHAIVPHQHHAVNMALLQLLLDGGADASERWGDQKQNALVSYFANCPRVGVSINTKEITQLLLAADKTLADEHDAQGMLALHYLMTCCSSMAIKNYEVLVALLFHDGENVNATTLDSKRTPLHCLALGVREGRVLPSSFIAMTRVLLAAGASVDEEDNDGYSPLALLLATPTHAFHFEVGDSPATCCEVCIIEDFFEKRIDASKPTPRITYFLDGSPSPMGRRPIVSLLHLAVLRTMPHLVEYFLSRTKVNPNERNDDGNTPLMLALKVAVSRSCVGNREQMIRTLLARADRSEPNPLTGETVLHHAAKAQVLTSRVLVKQSLNALEALAALPGFNPNDVDVEGNTALFFARRCADITALRSAGADPFIRNLDGQDAFSFMMATGKLSSSQYQDVWEALSSPDTHQRNAIGLSAVQIFGQNPTHEFLWSGGKMHHCLWQRHGDFMTKIGILDVDSSMFIL